MRVVLDTNIVVSALIWGGKPLNLLQAATAGDIELYTSPALLAELREVLGREHLASRLAAQRASLEQTVGFYGDLAIGVSPLAVPRVVPNDPDTIMSSPRPWPPRPTGSSAATAICCAWSITKASSSSTRTRRLTAWRSSSRSAAGT